MESDLVGILLGLAVVAAIVARLMIRRARIRRLLILTVMEDVVTLPRRSPSRERAP